MLSPKEAMAAAPASPNPRRQPTVDLPLTNRPRSRVTGTGLRAGGRRPADVHGWQLDALDRAVIRRYDPEDRDVLLAVWEESAVVAHPFWTPAMFEQERQAIAERFLPVAETYVFERSGTVVGFISLLGNEVGGIFVAPQHQGQGIGRALMDRARGTRGHLELDVFEANRIGRAFYAAYGFGIVGERVDEGTGQRVLRLRLP